MANEPDDDDFERFVLQAALARQADVDRARLLQAEEYTMGFTLTFGESLVRLGVINRQQREDVERLLLTRAQGLNHIGKYKILNKLGDGGMGVVYLAEDESNGQKVAIKVLLRHYAEDPVHLKRFKREAKVASKLKHPNIVTALEEGFELGHHFYVMEYFLGMSLADIIERDKFLPCVKALNIIEQVARGLQYAHDQGIIHRDIKPANIYLTNDGKVKILDLGLHKNTTEEEHAFHTKTGLVMGTPHFIAPEQVDRSPKVDARTDIYSLGATLFLLVTGEAPFWGDTASVIMTQHVKGELPNPQSIRKGLPDGVTRIVIKMMAKKPSERYQTCSELIDDIERVKSERTPASGIMAPAVSAVARTEVISIGAKRFKPFAKHEKPAKLLIVVGALALAYLLVLIGLTIFKRG